MKEKRKRKNNILLGITGCISCYKSVGLLRMLVKEGFDVKVVFTPAVEKFMTPLIFRTLSKNKVYVDLFADNNDWCPEHISLTDWADLFVIAPASANTINKIAGGIADNLLCSTVLAFDKDIIIAPSMNERMYNNEVFQKNKASLGALDRFYFVEPVEGDLACGVAGKGRLAELEDIVAKINDKRM